MGNNLEGPGTQLADVDLGYWIEPIVYIVANGVLIPLCARSLKNELKDPRSQEVVNMKKLMIATGASIIVWNISMLPPIYIEPHMWQVEEFMRGGLFNTTLSTATIHFNWLAVLADYASNLKQDQQGLQRFTQESIKLNIAANLVFLAAVLGRVITGKLDPWQKIESVGWMIVLSVFVRGCKSYYMIHKKCMNTLRKDIKLRISNSKQSSQAELNEVSKENFDLSKVELTRSEAEQKAKLDKIRKKIFLLLLILVPGLIVTILNIVHYVFTTDWEFNEVSWIEPSQPYVAFNRGYAAAFVTVALAYWLYYFRVPQTQ